MTQACGRTYRKRKKKSLNNIENSSHLSGDVKNLNLLRKWMGENGFSLTKRLHPFIFKDSGRGLRTKERISVGDIIVSIPEKLLILPKTVLSLSLGNYFKKFCPKASGHQILSAFLMCEKAKQKASEWYPYIKTLPQSYDIPGFSTFFSSVCLPASMNSYVNKQIELVKCSYEQLKILFENLESSFPSLHNTLDFDLYKWAWCTVNTRCVYIDCFLKYCPGKSCTYHLALAPYLDLLNHSSEVQVDAGFNKETKQYEIKSLVNFKAYSQVFINYGPHDNRTLLFEYGFIESLNPNHFVSFSDDDVIYAYEQCLLKPLPNALKLNVLYQNNLFSNMTCSCDGLSWNLNTVLSILSSDNEMKWRKSYDLKCHDIYNCDTGNNEMFKKLKAKLLSLKLNEYESYPVSKRRFPSDEFIYLENVINTLYRIELMLLTKAM